MQTFSALGVKSAATILNLVVISAAISAINSDIFGAGRMMFGMARQRHAPRVLMTMSRHGVPWITVLVMAGALFVGAAWLTPLAAVFYARIRPKFAAASR